MASPLAHRVVTALAVTLGVGALAASASGMRSVDAELASATTPIKQEQKLPDGAPTVRDGDPVNPCPDPKKPARKKPITENEREI